MMKNLLTRHAAPFRDARACAPLVQNVMIDEEGHVKIIDFGLVKHLLPNESTKSFVGTPDYMSPVSPLKKHCWRCSAAVSGFSF
jgi:hypothetical protein